MWIDTINGTGVNDSIGGETRARYYTYSSDWYDSLTEWFSTRKMWDGKVTAQKACEDYAATFQAFLDEMRANMGG